MMFAELIPALTQASTCKTKKTKKTNACRTKTKTRSRKHGRRCGCR